MGDIAGMIYDQFVAGGWDLDEDDPGYQLPRLITCRYCGKTGLRWHPQQAKVLVDRRGAVHDCRGPASPDEFDVVS